VLQPVTMRAKLALAAFIVVTLLYGSVCSTTCALGACPSETQNAATHDCDHSAPAPAHDGAPQNPDCPQHHHPTYDAVGTDALAQSQLVSARHAAAAQLLAVTVRSGEFTGVSMHAFSPHLAPAPNLNISLSQQSPALRI
jgi:hypothetical protein